MGVQGRPVAEEAVLERPVDSEATSCRAGRLERWGNPATGGVEQGIVFDLSSYEFGVKEDGYPKFWKYCSMSVPGAMSADEMFDLWQKAHKALFAELASWKKREKEAEKAL